LSNQLAPNNDIGCIPDRNLPFAIYYFKSGFAAFRRLSNSVKDTCPPVAYQLNRPWRSPHLFIEEYRVFEQRIPPLNIGGNLAASAAVNRARFSPEAYDGGFAITSPCPFPAIRRNRRRTESRLIRALLPPSGRVF